MVTHTPIKHVIIIIGENWSFDSLFATYPPKSGETVKNLLSEKIVKPDGSPGTNYSKAPQSSATDNGTSQLAPPAALRDLPPSMSAAARTSSARPRLRGASKSPSRRRQPIAIRTANVAKVMPFENGLSLTPTNAGGPVYYQYLLTGGTGQKSSVNTGSTLVPDTRPYYDGADASTLPSGPFQLTQMAHSPFLPYDPMP